MILADVDIGYIPGLGRVQATFSVTGRHVAPSWEDPGDEPEVEVLAARVEDDEGEWYSLTLEELERFEQAIWEACCVAAAEACDPY